MEASCPSGTLTLHGFLYRPAGREPFPAILYNHGSEQRPGWRPELGALFIARGFAFLQTELRPRARP